MYYAKKLILIQQTILVSNNYIIYIIHDIFDTMFSFYSHIFYRIIFLIIYRKKFSGIFIRTLVILFVHLFFLASSNRVTHC